MSKELKGPEVDQPEEKKFKDVSVEGVSQDKNKAISECQKLIVNCIEQYDPKVRFLIASRIVNHLWAWVFQPVMGAVTNNMAEQMAEKEHAEKQKKNEANKTN